MTNPKSVLIFLASCAILATLAFMGFGDALMSPPVTPIPWLGWNPFKVLRLLNVVFVMALLYRGASAKPRSTHLPRWIGPLSATLIAVTYLPSFQINLWDHDWTHRHIGATLTSWHAFAQLFVHPQVDGMYRPLAFLTFALDYRIFGDHLWGYHLQSVLLHILNSFLVWKLGRALNFGRETSFFGALIFGVSAIHFEAVLWPAARFDLLACLFVLLSLLCFLEWWKADGPRRIWFALLSLGCVAAAVLNKETGYSAFVLIPVLALTHRIWNLPETAAARKLRFAVALALTGAILAWIRLSLFHGPGGFQFNTADAAASHVSWKSVYLCVLNLAGLSPFGINVDHVTIGTQILTLCHVVTVIALIPLLMRKGSWVLFALALLSALPALPVMGWIRPSLVHSRHLYLPSVWLALLLGMAIQRARFSGAILFVFALLQVIGVNWNILIYRETVQEAREVAMRIEREVRDTHAAEVQLMNVPPDLNGVWYFDTQLVHELDLAGVRSRLCDSTCTGESNTLIYHWK